MKIRIVEAGGAWEYVKQVDNVEHRWHFECRTSKPKGKGGRKKRPDEERIDLLKSHDTSKLLTMASDGSMARLRRFWENTTPVHYVMLDPEHAWIVNVTWTQQEEFWLEMINDPALSENCFWLLQGIDHLVRMNVDAKGGLRAASAVAALIVNRERPDFVRKHACEALVVWHEKHSPSGVPGTPGWAAMSLLVGVYKDVFLVNGELKPINQDSKGEVVVRPAILRSLACMHQSDGILPDMVKDLLLDALQLAVSFFLLV